MQFYVIVPVIFLFLNKFGFFRKLLMMFLLLILSNFYIDYTALKTSSYDFRTLSGNLSFFFIGMFCAILKEKFINSKLILNNLKVIIFFLSLFFVANIYIMSVSHEREIFNFFYFWTTQGLIFAQIGFVVMIFLSIYLEKIEYNSFITEALYLLVNSAYALYASHVFFIRLIGSHITFFNFSIYILCSILFSFLVYKYLEKPILKYKLK
jgi:peptidoglycan/LPS O-acetylase OafA/YrhL